MLRIAHVSDIHLDCSPVGKLRRDTFESTLRCMRAFADGCREREVDLILVTGDLINPFQANQAATIKERNAITDWFLSLAEIAPVVGVRGNHERRGDFSFLNSLRSGYAICWIEECKGFPWMTTGSGADDRQASYMVHAIPWLSPAWFDERLKELQALGEDIDKNTPDWKAWCLSIFTDPIKMKVEENPHTIHILAAHAAIEEHSFGDGQEQVGTEVAIPAQLFQDFGVDYAAFGHLHTPTEVFPGGHYAGSVNRISFGEAGKQCSWNYVEVVDSKPGDVHDGDYMFSHTDSHATRVHRIDLPADDLQTTEIDIIEDEFGDAIDMDDACELRKMKPGQFWRVRVNNPYGISHSSFLDTWRQRAAEIGAKIIFEHVAAETRDVRAGADEISRAQTLGEKYRITAAEEGEDPDNIDRQVGILAEIEGEI